MNNMTQALVLLACALATVAARGAELLTRDQVRGPRLTDPDFFAALDLTRPGLAQVATAVAAGDFPRAKAALLAYYREAESGRARGAAAGPAERTAVAGGAD